MYSIDQIKEKLINNKEKKTIVFPEGNELKIQQVAEILTNNKIANCILLFNNKNEIPENIFNNKNIQSIDLESLDKSNFIEQFLELRKNKATSEMAEKVMNHPNYIGCMYVYNELADCMLSGLTYTTADTIRPALQIIKTQEGISTASSVFIMNKENENYVFTDCALNIKPTSEQIADIATSAANFSKNLGVKDVEVAMLSYSTNGSGLGEDVEKVRKATEIVKGKNIDFNIEGEIQFDAAFVKEIRDKKFEKSNLKKEIPDVFVFPDINAGNIGYKIAQRMGNYSAIGPFILGLKKPINDLSRGATLNDILNTAIMTLFLS